MPQDRFNAANFLRRAVKGTLTLDQPLVKIFSTMHKLGPRNLMTVARKTGLPFSTIYSKINRWDLRYERFCRAIVANEKLGLVRLELLVESKPGLEDFTRRALEIPNYWYVISSADGGFSHFAVQRIPKKALADFVKYVRSAKKLGIIRRFVLFKTSNFYPAFPDFRWYDPKRVEWIFDWNAWLIAVTKGKITRTVHDPIESGIQADKTDILILKELEKNARARFSDIAKLTKTTLQAVKYRFDKKILPRKLIHDYAFQLSPYPPELADKHLCKIDFADQRSMNRFFSLALNLFFVVGVSKIIGRNSLLVRTYVPRSQITNLYNFLSSLARLGGVEDYSSVRLNPDDMRMQTLSYELFDPKEQWQFPLRKMLEELAALKEQAVRKPRAR